MARANRRSFAGDAVAAALVLAGLSGLTYGVRIQPLRIPGYVLLIGFGTLGATVGPRAAFPVVYGGYLVALGAVGAAAVRALRRRLPETHLARWRLGAAGALGTTGVLSISVAITALFGTAQPDAVVVTSLSGLVLLGLAGWSAGAFVVGIGGD